MLLDPQGQLVQSSLRARFFCNRLLQGSTPQSSNPKSQSHVIQLPDEVTKLADSLIESRELFPELRFQLQDDVLCADGTELHLQARWIHLESQRSPHIIVTLTNLTESTHQQALYDAYQYNLTPRETEVWKYRLQGFSYEQICKGLYIEKNTVKKHIKSINRKRCAECL